MFLDFEGSQLWGSPASLPSWVTLKACSSTEARGATSGKALLLSLSAARGAKEARGQLNRRSPHGSPSGWVKKAGMGMAGGPGAPLPRAKDSREDFRPPPCQVGEEAGAQISGRVHGTAAVQGHGGGQQYDEEADGNGLQPFRDPQVVRVKDGKDPQDKKGRGHHLAEKDKGFSPSLMIPRLPPALGP